MTHLQTERGIVRVPPGTWKVDPVHSSVGFLDKASAALSDSEARANVFPMASNWFGDVSAANLLPRAAQALAMKKYACAR